MKRALTTILSAVFLFYGCASKNYAEKPAERPASYEESVLQRAEENKKRLIETCKAYSANKNLTKAETEFYNATCRFYSDENKNERNH